MFENVPDDIAQITHAIRNIFADVRNVPPNAVFCVTYGRLESGLVAEARLQLTRGRWGSHFHNKHSQAILILSLCLEYETFIRGVVCPNLCVCVFVCLCVWSFD